MCIEMEMKNEYLDWQDDKYRIGNHEKINLDITTVNGTRTINSQYVMFLL